MSTTPAPIIVRAQVIDAGAVQTAEVHVDPRDAASNPDMVNGLLHDCAHRVALAVGVAPAPAAAEPAAAAAAPAVPDPAPAPTTAPEGQEWACSSGDGYTLRAYTPPTPGEHVAALRTTCGGGVYLKSPMAREVAAWLTAAADAWDASERTRTGDQ